ncbi:MAG: bifunctional diaminohydroxyphosphoribosylaminopyrimidine deaminase/5-amino-6-(5-phosphoribosylamino)uracil reductase RibD [Calditrichia bacterium]
MEDVIYMERAHFLAKKVRVTLRQTRWLVLFLVKNNEIIGEGYHAKSGEFHAEIAAIENATAPVRGATLYCNLEPCCHQTSEKRTPPCTNRIIREGIEKVVISTLDPNPHVSGRGVATLQAAGIAVETGLLAEKAALLNQAFSNLSRPVNRLSISKLLNRWTAELPPANNHSQWITDETARTRVHEWRSQKRRNFGLAQTLLKWTTRT